MPYIHGSEHSNNIADIGADVSDRNRILFEIDESLKNREHFEKSHCKFNTSQ